MEVKQYKARLLKFDENRVSKEVFNDFFEDEIGRSFRERLENTLIRGEFGPPVILPIMSMSERINRTSHLNELSICLAVVSHEVRDDGLYGIIQPVGQMGRAMMEHLDTRHEDTAVLSMRHLGRTEFVEGAEHPRVTKIQRIIAFDLTDQFV